MGTGSRELRGFPRTDRVLAHPLLADARARLGPVATLELVRLALAAARERAQKGHTEPTGQAPVSGEGVVSEEEVARGVKQEAERWLARRTRRVINATGVVLHTNLGRAPLCDAAILALGREGAGYVSLEVDLATGQRGGRASYAERAIATLARAEAALVVNNNAAAVLLALAAFALGRTVLVSRGELVEIGGGFRVPEVLARSGARLVEVGTTNRTRAEDYARALDNHPDASAILRVHPGNFRQVGFVERPTLPELVALGRARGVAVIEDLGGGALVDLPGLAGDPLVRDSVSVGADLVTFSTDKILGGPQGGVLAGTRKAVDLVRRDPLARALRLGRLPLVALETTLDAYLRDELASIPALAMVKRPIEELRARAVGWARALEGIVATRVVDVTSVTGGGTFAGEEMPSVALAIDTPDADKWLGCLRSAPAPVLARIKDGAVLLDARTVLPEEDGALVAAVQRAAQAAAGSGREP
jgi:L-seryl-tRNA(Ser) seleniumtransferase